MTSPNFEFKFSKFENFFLCHKLVTPGTITKDKLHKLLKQVTQFDLPDPERVDPLFYTIQIKQMSSKIACESEGYTALEPVKGQLNHWKQNRNDLKQCYLDSMDMCNHCSAALPQVCVSPFATFS